MVRKRIRKSFESDESHEFVDLSPLLAQDAPRHEPRLDVPPNG
jgi:hypothetical protein